MFGRDLFLGIDLGTTSVKAVLADEQGFPIEQGAAEYPIYQPHPNWAEQSPEAWWQAVVEVVSSLVKRQEDGSTRVKGISVSCQAPTCLGIDEKGVPVSNALIWMDRRAQEICDGTLRPYAERIRAVCGNRVDPYYFLPKLLWMQTYRPEERKKAKLFLQVNGWIIFKMTGKPSIDTTHLTHLQVYDVFQDRWDETLLHSFGIDQTIFPPIYQPWQSVGDLTSQAAEALGLKAGIPVAAGCTDAAAVTLGLHHTEPGRLFEMSGQSSGIGLILDQPVKHELLNLSKGAFPDRWTQKGSMSSSGGSLRWFRDQFEGRQGEPVYEEYDRLAQQSPPGARGVVFMPYLAGERAPLWDSDACGILFGLRTITGKQDILRAIMEGTAFGLRTIKDVFDPSYLDSAYLYGTGGGYRSRLWSQIKADVLGMPIQVLRVDCDAACIGDVYLAMRCSGRPDRELPWRRTVETVYEPNPAVRSLYEEEYQIFRALYQNNRYLMKRNMKLLSQQI